MQLRFQVPIYLSDCICDQGHPEDYDDYDDDDNDDNDDDDDDDI